MSDDSLMLHFRGNGLVEIEVWEKDIEKATNVFTERLAEKKSVDLTDALRRAGFKIVPSGDEVKSGERYAKSPTTGQYYRVWKWVDKGDGNIVSRAKEEVDREDVPEMWLNRLDGEEVRDE